MKIVEKKLSELKPYERNPRKNDEAVDYVTNSIKEFGFKVPMVIDKDNVIVAGHTRYKACKKLGIDVVPCVIADDLTDEQIKAFRLADNKVSEYADWDFELLTDEMSNIIDIDLSEFGFDGLSDISIQDEGIIDDKDDDFYYFSKEEIQKDIINGWKTYASLDEYVSNIIDIPTAKYQYNRLCQGYNDGHNISLLFNKHRLDTETIKNKSIYYAINNDEKYRKEFARYLINVQNKVVPISQYYKFIGIGHASYQYVNEFQPYLARDIYKKYCKDGDKILNPCAGWGGRIIGLSSCRFNDIEYVETDPQKDTFKGLVEIKEFLKLGDNYKQYNLPFEELEVKGNYFDFVFTSPPYFDTERYGNEETQSYANKSNYDEWRNDFLFPMLDKIYFCMKQNATCLLNVGKVRYPIDTDIIEYMNKKYDVRCKRVKDFKIGGSGIGARTDDEGDGEPFIEFKKE